MYKKKIKRKPSKETGADYDSVYAAMEFHSPSEPGHDVYMYADIAYDANTESLKTAKHSCSHTNPLSDLQTPGVHKEIELEDNKDRPGNVYHIPVD